VIGGSVTNANRLGTFVTGEMRELELFQVLGFSYAVLLKS
jgi:hypothetical protein